MFAYLRNAVNFRVAACMKILMFVQIGRIQSLFDFDNGNLK